MPPAPGMMPSPTSGKPTFAVETATRRSHASASSHPPPSACPLIAAIVGNGSASSSSRMRLHEPVERDEGRAVGELVDVRSGGERPIAGAGHDRAVDRVVVRPSASSGVRSSRHVVLRQSRSALRPVDR